MTALAQAADGREVTFSDNQPPVDPFDATKVHTDDLLDQARGVTAVTTAEQLESVKALEDELKAAADLLEKQRVAKKKPLDDEIAEIQTQFNVYLAPLKNVVKGKIPLALDALKKAKEPWLKALEDKRLAEVAAAQKKAADAAEAARLAIQAAAPEDMEAREEAEVLVSAALTASRVATRTTTAASAGTGLKSVWTPQVTDITKALIHYTQTRREVVEAFLLDLARKDCAGAIRTIPGFVVTEERVAR